jgi:DNA-binding transcriptional MerR regulator
MSTSPVLSKQAEMSPKIAEKLVYRLDEVCRLSGQDKETIETWESELGFIQPGQNSAGKKIYRKKDVDIILRLRELLEEQGHTLAGARRRIEEEFGLRSSGPVNQDQVKKALIRIKQSLKELKEQLKD